MKTACIAISSPEYLSRYRIMYKSAHYHLPDIDTILYYGGEDIPNDVGMVVNINEWVKNTQYTDSFLIYCSLRARMVLNAFERGYEKVILVGADIEWFGYPEAAIKALNDNDAFVTMYINIPYPDDALTGSNHQVWTNGQIQADFIAFSNTPKVVDFLKWVDKQLLTKCIVNGTVMVDQCYFSMCFSFLDKVYICKNLGYNVGSYNAQSRGISKHGDRWFMKDYSPLVLYHYDGLIKGQEESVSKHQNRYKATGDWLQFLKDYTNKL